MNDIDKLLSEPEYDPFKKEYVFLNGDRIDEQEYLRQCRLRRLEEEERSREANYEFSMRCIEATNLMNDMMSGYAPSIAYSRSRRRGNKHDRKTT